ncbi:ParA family protein [Nocardioides sp. 616]|uniref:ParA family protein n=1 Tax=Nocardioides sp. 616 TaxID=2268090 RepID=UPI0031F54610
MNDGDLTAPGRPELSTGPGGSPERDSPQIGRSYPQAGDFAGDVGEERGDATAGRVSRETSLSPVPASASKFSDRNPVSRETSNHLVDVLLSTPPVPHPSDTGSSSPVTSPQEPSATTGSNVSRGTGFRTAAQIAEQDTTAYDNSTPLARAAEHVVMARQGALGRQQPARPDHTRVMVVANQKGGVGKTTSTVNLAAAMAQLGQRVLVIDLDPQGNASTALNIDHHRGVPSTYDLLVDGAALADITAPCPELPNLVVCPATIDLAGAEIELVSVVARENRLHKAIQAHPLVGDSTIGDERFDYVFIDCPPSLGLLTLNALVAGAEMMIPIQAEYYALEGLGQLLETVAMVKAHLNPRLDVTTILITMYDARTRLAAGVAEEVREHFGSTVLKTMVPRSVRVSEAPSYGQTVMTYDPGSPGALSYLEAAREIAVKGAPAA